MKAIIASVAVVALFSILGVITALANPYVGNPLYWCAPGTSCENIALRQSRIGDLGGLVNGKPSYVCSYMFPNSTHSAMDRWNDNLDAPDPFLWYPQCDASTDVFVTTDQFGDLCPDWVHGCTVSVSISPGYPNYSIGYTHIALNPGDPTYFDSSDDNTPHVTRDIAHELGHSFGAGEYHGCTSDPPSIMDTDESCFHEGDPGYGQIQTVDVTNYFTLYRTDPVYNLHATVSSDKTVVDLAWEQKIIGPPSNPDIPNEEGFCVSVDGGELNIPGGCVGRNVQSMHLTGQTPISHDYRIFTISAAVPYYYWGSDHIWTTPDLIITAAPSSTTQDEGGTKTFSVTVKNQGNTDAGPFAIDIKFNGSYRPYPQGIYAFNNGLAAGAQQTVTTIAVNMNFPGGPMVAVADTANQVSEHDESNNTLAGGTLGVRPKPPNESTNDIVTWPPDAFYWVDRSNIETGFSVKVQRASSSCSSWSTRTTRSYGSSSGTGTQLHDHYTMAHGYCWRIQVRANGQFADSSYVSDAQPWWYP